MFLCDTHCHLNLNIFKADLESVLARSRQAGLERILVPGIDLPTSRTAVRLAEQWPEIYAAVGIHPNDGLTWKSDTLTELRELARHPKVCAIGEIGLDYYRDRCPRNAQADVLRQQLDLAGELGLPVVIHNRDAYEDLFPILSAWAHGLQSLGSPLADRPGVLHSFDGSLEQAEALINLNFLIGLNGPVTFKNAHDRHLAARQLPLDVLLLETDAPFLTPHPHRGERNEPSFIQYINGKIADLRGISADLTAETTSNNAQRLFSWRTA